MYATLVLLSIISAATSAPVPPNIPQECMEEIQKKYAHHLALSKDQVHDHSAIMKKVMAQIDFSKCMNVQFRIVMDDHEKPAQSKFPVDDNNERRPEAELKEENDAYVLNVKNEDYDYPNSDEERYDDEDKDYMYPEYENQHYHNEKVNKNKNAHSKKLATNSYGEQYVQTHNHRQLYGSHQRKPNQNMDSNTHQYTGYRYPNDDYYADSLQQNSNNQSKYRINNNKNPKVKIQNKNNSQNNAKHSQESVSENLDTQSEDLSNERYHEDNDHNDKSNNNDYWKLNKNNTPQSMDHDHHQQIVDYSTTKRADTSLVQNRASDNLENSQESVTQVPKIQNNNPSTGKYLENNGDNDRSNERYYEDNVHNDESNTNNYWKFDKNKTPQSVNEHDHHQQIVDYSTKKSADTSQGLNRASDNLENSYESVTQVPKIQNNNPTTGKYFENNSDNDKSNNHSSWDYDNETTLKPIINHTHKEIIDYATTNRVNSSRKQNKATENPKNSQESTSEVTDYFTINRADSSHKQNKATENPKNSQESESEFTDIQNKNVSTEQYYKNHSDNDKPKDNDSWKFSIQNKNVSTEQYYKNHSDNDKPKDNDSWKFSNGKTPHDQPWQIIDYSTLSRPDKSHEREHKHEIVIGKEVPNMNNDKPSTETFKDNNENDKKEFITTVKDQSSITMDYLQTTESTKLENISTEENKSETTTVYTKTTAESTSSSFAPNNEHTTPKINVNPTTAIESNEQNNYKTITEINEDETDQNDTAASEPGNDHASTESYHNTDLKEYSTTTEISHIATTTRETVEPTIETEFSEQSNQHIDNKEEQDTNSHSTPANNLQSTNDNEEKQKNSLVSFIAKISLDEAGLLTIDNQLTGEQYKKENESLTYFTNVFNTVYGLIWNLVQIIRSLIQTYG